MVPSSRPLRPRDSRSAAALRSDPATSRRRDSAACVGLSSRPNSEPVAKTVRRKAAATRRLQSSAAVIVGVAIFVCTACANGTSSNRGEVVTTNKTRHTTGTPGGTTTSGSRASTRRARARPSDIPVSVSFSAPTSLAYGEPATFTLHIQNIGPSMLAHVYVFLNNSGNQHLSITNERAIGAEGGLWEAQSVQPGSKFDIPIKVAFEETAASSGGCIDVDVGTQDSGGGKIIAEACAPAGAANAQPVPILFAASGPRKIVAGKPATYVATVRNLGPKPLHLRIGVPLSTPLDNASEAHFSSDGNSLGVNWALPASGTRSIQVAFRPRSSDIAAGSFCYYGPSVYLSHSTTPWETFTICSDAR
jgi:hypothetical protein